MTSPHSRRQLQTDRAVRPDDVQTRHPAAALEAEAHALAAALPRGTTVDLVANYAAPWSLALAKTLTGVSTGSLSELTDAARVVFLHAAYATSGVTAPTSDAAVRELAAGLPAGAGALAVQAFVAITQTLPHLLASVWLSLLRDAAAMQALRNPHGVNRGAVDELLRHGGPARAVFRLAREDVRIGDARIRAGDAVVLRLAAANHDPRLFTAPDRLDFARMGSNLAFGYGGHACPGARLMRTAVAALTTTLLSTAAHIELAEDPAWVDGFAIRAPATLNARLAASCRR